MERLPANWEANSLLPYSSATLEVTKCNTALEALQIDAPQISKIKKEHGGLAYVKGLGFILKKLFTVRFSKTQFTPELLDEFSEWIIVDYYFLKLQEIEIALLDYRGEVYQVIDLECLKVMIEEYSKRRVEASHKTRKDEAAKIQALPSGTTSDRWEEIKELLTKLAVRRQIKEIEVKKVKRATSLEELFQGSGIKDPVKMAKDMRDGWKREWESLSQIAKGDRLLAKHSEPLEMFLKRKETYFIIQSSRPIPFGK